MGPSRSDGPAFEEDEDVHKALHVRTKAPAWGKIEIVDQGLTEEESVGWQSVPRLRACA